MIQLVQRHKRLMIQALILINYFFVVFVVGWNHYVEGDSWRTIVRMFDTERLVLQCATAVRRVTCPPVWYHSLC